MAGGIMLAGADLLATGASLPRLSARAPAAWVFSRP
jgi:hypothetical protein